MDYCLVLTLIAIPVTLVAIIIFVKTGELEKQINKLYKEKEEKIKKERKKAIPNGFIKGTIKSIEKEYKPKIEELERKRRFLLDKLPFLKK